MKKENTSFQPNSKLTKLLKSAQVAVIYADGIVIEERRSFDDIDRGFTIKHGVECDLRLESFGTATVPASTLFDGLSEANLELDGKVLMLTTPNGTKIPLYLENLPGMTDAFATVSDSPMSIHDNGVDAIYNYKGKRFSTEEETAKRLAHSTKGMSNEATLTEETATVPPPPTTEAQAEATPEAEAQAEATPEPQVEEPKASTKGKKKSAKGKKKSAKGKKKATSAQTS